MNIDYDTFFKKIEIEEEEKEKAKYFIRTRGLEEHIRMANFLLSFNNGKKPTYKEIATAFRYDKRIRRIIYKYIGFLEEYYRASLCNKFKLVKDIVEYEKEGDKPIYDFLSNKLFRELFELILKQNKDFIQEVFERKNIVKCNLYALNDLRDKVSHNYTIITNMNLHKVIFGKIKKATLETNIKNLLYYLPEGIKESFKKEINEAKKVGSKKNDKQVEWDLPKFLAIKLK